MTSGGQVILSATELRKLGVVVADVLYVIDREPGGRENMERHGLTLHALFMATELKASVEGE